MVQEDVKTITKPWLKYTYCKEPGSILIDDNRKLAAAWIRSGGAFIHFKNLHQASRESEMAGVSQHATVNQEFVEWDQSTIDLRRV